MPGSTEVPEGQNATHLTEWKQFREIDPAKLAVVVANPTIIDGRNAIDPTLWRGAGLAYRTLGRPTV